MSAPDLSVVVVSWNTRAYLERCLAALEASAPELALEIIVVDNGSTDGTLAWLARREPAVRLVANRQNVGFAAANNQALAIARAPVVLLLNSDAFLPPGTIQAALGAFAAQPRAGVVGVRVLNPDGTLQAAAGQFPSFAQDVLTSLGLERGLRRHPAPRAEAGPADWVHGACMFARAAAVREVGPLDDRFFMYSEEVEWCRRFWKHGWQVWYLPDATVTHVGGASSVNDTRRRLALYRSRLGFRRKEGGRFASGALWLLMLLGLLARIVARALGQALLRRQVGAQSARGDWELLRGLARSDPFARWATS